MKLDGLTLMVAGSFVTAVSGMLLLGAWAQIRNAALLWWSSASFIYSVAIGFLSIGLSTGSPLITAAGGALGAVHPALIWAGVRRFGHRRTPLTLIFAGAVVGLAAGLLPVAGAPEVPAAVAGFAAWIVYLSAAGFALWRGSTEHLSARWPLIAFFAFHAAVFLAGIVDTLSGFVPGTPLAPFTSLFSIVHFETLIYSIGTAVFMVLLCKQESERGHIAAARNDSLTGIANRGAFLESAERLLGRCQKDGTSISLIMFDLDRFKWVNDTFGHGAGDDVIRAFANTTRTTLRPSDLFCRYGGEEFAVLLPGATVEAAYVIAERVRHSFAEGCAFFGERPLNATVSAGVAAAASAEATMESLMQIADRNLYRAKSLGRNRVERGDEAAADKVARIA